MTLRKILLTSLITPTLTLFCIILYFITSDKSYDVMDFLFGLMISVVVWVTGTVPALLLSNIFKTPKYEPRFYLGTQLAIIAAAIMFLVIARLSNNKEISNYEHNIDLINTWDTTQEETNRQKRLLASLRELESNFPDSNSFRLTSYHSKMEDTVLNGVQQLYNVVYYTYHLEPGQPEMLARIIVTEKSAITDFFNIKAGKNKEYLTEKRRVRSLLDSTVKEITKLADSLTKQSPQKP